MTNLRGASLVVALTPLVALTVACEDGSPTTPTPITPAEPIPTPTITEITITVTTPYFNDSVIVFPSLSGARVTCLLGCEEGQPTEATGDDGQVSFRGTSPITVRVEKVGYASIEQTVSHRNRVFLGHEWPSETARSSRMLRRPSKMILSWGVAEESVGGNFSSCLNDTSDRAKCVALVTVANFRHGREKMLSTLEHELFHGHQSAYPAPYQSSLQHWVNGEEGRAWAEAQKADRDAGRVVPDYLDENPHNFTVKEGAAEFWSWWRRAVPTRTFPQHQVHVDNLCEIATSRCALVEQWFGPRPTSYP